MIEAPDLSLTALAPLLFVFGAACLGVLLEAFWPRESRHPVQVAVALVGTFGAFVTVDPPAGADTRPASTTVQSRCVTGVSQTALSPCR